MDADTTPEAADFGHWLRRRRRALDLTQKELALRSEWADETPQGAQADLERPWRPRPYAAAALPSGEPPSSR